MKLIAASPALVLAFVVAASCAGAPPARTAAVDTTVPASDISCRELLVVASNQLTRVCGTGEQWDRYDRRMAAASQALVLRMQGSAFGGY